MSIFTPTIYNEPSFSGLFRLLDDFDQYRTSAANSANQQQQQQMTSGANTNNNNNGQRQLFPRGGFGGLLGQTGSSMLSFTPKFDLRETDTAFELRGDLPGVEKDQVHIEFADEHTLTIRGRVEREWSNKSEAKEKQDSTATTTQQNDTPVSNGHEKESSSSGAKDKDSSDKAAAVSAGGEKQQLQQQSPAKYWITERSVGEFSRSFRLTGHHHHNYHHGGRGQEEEDVEIDHDGVTAKLENGVLNVVVPKVVKERKQPRRRVEIH